MTSPELTRVYPKKWNRSNTIRYGLATTIAGMVLVALSLHPDVAAWLETIDRAGPVYMLINGLVIVLLRLITGRPIAGTAIAKMR